MSLFTRVSALVFIALGAAFPFAGCSSATSSNCSFFCKASLACVTADRCTFVDPGAAEDACTSSCEGGFNGLTDAETKAITDCMSCNAQQVPDGQCLNDVPDKHACDAVCDTPAASAAAEKWLANIGKEPTPEGTACTNGRNYTSGSCDYSSDGTSCTVSCCNGDCGAKPDVGITCDVTGSPVTCTCTAGKNQGKTFTPAIDPCDVDEAWNQCNL